MDPGERMREAYDRIADAYTERYGEVDPTVAGWGMRFAATVLPGARVLDVGCGPGQYMAWLESHGIAVVGVDLSMGMLAQARAGTRGELLQMDMRRLAFRPESFGGVWCVASLLHLPEANAREALQEMWRVLTPGGALLIIVQEGAGEGWEENRFFGTVQRFYARYSRDEAESLLRDAGFTVLDTGRNESALRTWLQFLAVKPTVDPSQWIHI